MKFKLATNLIAMGTALTLSVSPVYGGGSTVQAGIEWQRVRFGTTIGFSGIEIADLEGDSIAEIVMGGSISANLNTCWRILRRVGSKYETVYVSPSYTPTFSSHRVANVDGDSDLDIVVGRNGVIEVFDGTTRALLHSVPNGATEVRGLRIADVDSDGSLEFVFCDDNELFIHDALTGVEEARIPGRGGRDLDVGNVDDDPDMEIAIGNLSAAGYVLNGITRAVEWNHTGGFGDYVRLDDLDNDGKDELVSGFRGSDLTVYDLGPLSQKYVIHPVGILNTVTVGDVEGDGSLEVIYGDDQWSDVYVHNGQTGAFKWSADSTDYNVNGIAVGDCDNDGVREIVWGTGSASQTSRLFVASTIGAHAVEWKSPDFVGPFFGIDAGDVDNDGQKELVFSYSRSDGADGRFFVHDTQSYFEEFMSTTTFTTANLGTRRLCTANVDADPQQEIFITTSQFEAGRILCFDGITHAQQWAYSIPNGQGFRSMAIADIDGDGTLELLAGTYRANASATGSYVYQLNAANGAFEWQSGSLGTATASLQHIQIANVDSDPALEIVVAEHGGGLWFIDGPTHAIELQTANLSTRAIDTADLNGDGISEVFVANSFSVRLLDSSTGTIASTLFTASSTSLQAIQVGDVISGPPVEIACATFSKLSIHTLDGAVLWSQSVPVGLSLGEAGSMLMGDIDDDGRTELVVNLGTAELRVYQTEVLPMGDINCDNFVDQSDIGTFVLALTEPEAYLSQYPSCTMSRADFTADSHLDGNDISGFVSCLTTPGPCGP